jgi:hypothetical protein
MDEFDRELNRPPAEQWKGDPNPLVGTLIHRWTYDGGEYQPAEMLVIEPSGGGGPYSVLCGKAVLRSFVEEEDPQVGGRVGIKKLGKRESGSGRSYDDFNTAYEPPSNGDAPATRDDDDGPPF